MREDIYKEYYELRKKNKRLQSVIRDVNRWLYCMGGPLNDNILNFNKEQVKYCFQLRDIIMGDCDDE